jgi:ABC-type polysaccharide/polyol phosphate export permease
LRCGSVELSSIKASKPAEKGVLVFGGAYSRGLSPALADLCEGLSQIEFWHIFAANDVRARYRRSRLGEFWLVISLGVFVIAVGGVYGRLLGQQMADYLPRLTIGFVLWTLFSTLTNDRCQSLISAKAF